MSSYGNSTGVIELWLKVYSHQLGLRNIVRVLSPTPFSPFKIPFDQLIKFINENEGTIEFVISDVGNLFDKSLSHVLIFDLPIDSSRFILWREGYFYFYYYHLSSRTGVRLARLDITPLACSKGLHIFVTWSAKESNLYVSDLERKVGLLKAKAESKPTRVVAGKDGSLVLIGDEDVDVRIVYIKKGKELIIEPTAKELFDFNIERINILISGCTSGDFLFESTCVQLGIVLLVSALETYLKKRFLELEREGWTANFDALCEEIFPLKYREKRREEIEEKAIAQGRSKLEVLVEEAREMNFQDINKYKRVYNACYGIKIGELVNSELMEKVRRFILFRHKIVHGARDLTILNYDEIPQKDPIFANKRTLEEVRDTFIEFIKKFMSSQ
ncbi:MAG: hypothetical protein QXO91_00675 [Desulfurococcaceae archaeon]